MPLPEGSYPSSSFSPSSTSLHASACACTKIHCTLQRLLVSCSGPTHNLPHFYRPWPLSADLYQTNQHGLLVLWQSSFEHTIEHLSFGVITFGKAVANLDTQKVFYCFWVLLVSMYKMLPTLVEGSLWLVWVTQEAYKLLLVLMTLMLQGHAAPRPKPCGFPLRAYGPSKAW